jgi:hypothetical protein
MCGEEKIKLRAATPLRNMKGKKFRLFYDFLIKFLGFLTKFVGKFVGERLSHAAKEKPGRSPDQEEERKRTSNSLVPHVSSFQFDWKVGKNRFIGYVRFIGSPDWEEEKKKKARQKSSVPPDS